MIRIKEFLLSLWDFIADFPSLFKMSVSVIKAYTHLKKKIIKNNLLDKKSTEKLLEKAFCSTYLKDVEKYADALSFNSDVLRSKVIYWIRKYGLQKESIDKFCDEEMRLLEYDLTDGDLLYQIKGSDYVLIESQISKYKELKKEIDLREEELGTLH